MVIGTCDGKVPSWYFDSGSKTCEIFTYGGCLGNSNRFATKADCEAKCISQQTSSCKDSKYGCCPDGKTPAGLNYEGCSKVNISSTNESCEEAEFGCCSDGFTLALGPFKKGCPSILNCNKTKFDCCPDAETIAKGINMEGCPEENNCTNSTHGCCLDGRTETTGPEIEGCLQEIDCRNATFRCCSVEMRVATCPNLEGCETSLDNKGCRNVTDCTSSEFGCCLDNMTAALGLDLEGCNETVTDKPPESTTELVATCTNTSFGCCPDEITIALGPNLEGCCFGLRFGCCPDNKTAALGPSYRGCGCLTYPYGCCPDGITPAEGINYQGCQCQHFLYGCCQDMVTPAKGHNFEGCTCQFMQYGCCPDGRTPILNERGEGCGCDSTRYGCCSDGKTAASSFDLSGCPCNTLPYGCCPDGHTPARTSDLRDCPCEAHKYGCCLDGRTIARGPEHEGCPCDSTQFGCCMDGKTTAQGPDFAGCLCHTTRYGCCADGYTPASGFHYEGCPDVQPPKPPVSTEVCILPKKVGPCKNFTVKWFYDVAYGGCSRFWYGGCDSNGNVFASQEDCENVCVKPEGQEICLLPKVAGSCDGKVPSWYFDAGSKKCETFIYGGCLGNNNRFVSKTDCEAKCISNQPPIPVTTASETSKTAKEASSTCKLFCIPKGGNFDQKVDSEMTDETKCRDDGSKDTCINGKLESLLDATQQNRSNWTPNTNSSHFVPTEGPEYGPWGPWTESSQCSRTCGGGVAHQDRICMDMRPDGRQSCIGHARRYLSCNIQDCPSGSKDFRGMQCSKFNTIPYKGQYFSWLPYHHANSPCALFCTPKGGKFYQMLDTKVIDGTKCKDDESKHICVNGLCMTVGCDGKLGSSTSEDECGICGGDGSTCTVLKGLLDKDEFEIGYNDILLIPVGSTSILIQRVQPSQNYLAVRNLEGAFYLNGNWRIEFPRKLQIAGTVFSYERKPRENLSPETLRARGPTTEAVFIVLLYQEKNLGIRYEYSVPRATRTPSLDSYIWTTGDFDPCSQSCGGGVQHRSVCCVRESDCDILDERLCDPLSKPDVNATCNNEPCPASWIIGEWNECTSECGGGTQFRLVYCYQQKDGNIVLAPDELCDQPKPLFLRSCNVDKECPDWITGEWSECSVLCGGGERTRKILCFHEDEEVEQSQCDPKKKPFDKENCNMMPCDDDADICRLPHDSGLCNEFQWRWYFDYESKNCLRFIYSGCDGNVNNFASYQECEKRCGHDTDSESSTDLEFKTDGDICRLPHDIGPCNEFRERWYFDYETTKCHRFIYGGCDGNANNFASYPECERKCGQETDSDLLRGEFDPKYCFLPQDSGPCSISEVNWFYDSTDGVCKEFYYGGCKGNNNRFKSRKECETSCFKAQDMCSLPLVKGPCSGSFIQWYYDPSQDDCLEFTFGGCQGNSNRFNSKEPCQQQCMKTPVTTEQSNISSDICSQPNKPGPCLGYYRQWYYDSSDNACKSFVYGGCEGNDNRFENRRDCEQQCVMNTSKAPVTPASETFKNRNEAVCRLPLAPGTCDYEYPRWFYDPQMQSCQPFVYGGCEGNKNRFKTAQICQQFCTGVKNDPATQPAMPTESDCIDNPLFSNCNVIVNANYCNNKYYGKLCCASCMKAGKLQDIPAV